MVHIADFLVHSGLVAPLAGKHQTFNSQPGRVKLPLHSVHLGIILNVEEDPLGGLFFNAEGSQRHHAPAGFDSQRAFNGLSVLKSEPAGAKAQLRHMQNDILRNKARVFSHILRLVGQNRKIVGASDHKIVVARRALQLFPGVGPEQAKLCADGGIQPSALAFVVSIYLRQRGVRDLRILKFPHGFAVLNHCAVIHSMIPPVKFSACSFRRISGVFSSSSIH
ncbi:hypothetical protein SDC9_79784 [bioreactor metagenome]|uniref:Uncharacterized protein n=1 Tax=bioreactor metagenome TaxID=1076179 RepID=A0A644YX93_9ZZZZ